MTRDQTLTLNPSLRNVSLGTFAAAAILGWVFVEVALRRGIVPVLSAPLGSALGADMIVSVIGFALITGMIAWYGQQLGITPTNWNYTASLRSIGAGLGGIAGYFVVYLAVVVLVTLLGGSPSSSVSIATGVAEEPLWAIGALVVVNGIFVPIIEEFAWRGVIQTALMTSYGTIVGSVFTAAAFVLKHVIVDAGEPLLRMVSLIVLALLLCGLRARFGTVSSTVTHLGVNSIATVLLITTG